MTVLRPVALPSGTITATPVALSVAAVRLRAAAMPVPPAVDVPSGASFLLINATDRLLINGSGDRLIISGA